MSKDQLDHAVMQIAGKVPLAYTYIFDTSESRFVYQSHDDASLEKELLSLDESKGLLHLVEDSPDGIFHTHCDNTGRYFLMKKIAIGLFFGMCVPPEERSIQTAMDVMVSAFSD